jgi:hypothetical protein
MTKNTASSHRTRRLATGPQVECQPDTQTGKSPSRLDQLEDLLCCAVGVSIAVMTQLTGWQQHSVRGAMAGALKKRGLIITSDKIDGERRYTANRPA